MPESTEGVADLIQKNPNWEFVGVYADEGRLKKLNSKIKRLKKAIEETAAQQEKASQPEMLLSAKVLQIQEYDDVLTARIIEKITVRSRNEIEIRFIGGYEKAMPLE